MRSTSFWLSLAIVVLVSSAKGMDVAAQDQPLVGADLTLAPAADATPPGNADFALSEQVALDESADSASVEPSQGSLSLVANDPAAVAPVAAAPASSGSFRVMTIGAPLLLQSAAAPAPVASVRRIGLERIYIVEGGFVRQYPSSSMKRFSSIAHRDHSKSVQAPKSFVKLSDSVRASAANVSFGDGFGSGYVERNFSVMSVPEVPEPATASLLLIGSAAAMLRRRRARD